MAIRLVNKSKADCDINLFSGRVVRIKPLSYITLDEKFTRASVDYYNQLRDLGLYLEKDPDPVVEEVPTEINAGADKENQEMVDTVTEPEVTKTEPEETSAPEVVKETTPSASAEGITEKELMKHTHGQLLEMASAYGLSGLEALSKKEICVKILEAAGAGE